MLLIRGTAPAACLLFMLAVPAHARAAEARERGALVWGNTRESQSPRERERPAPEATASSPRRNLVYAQLEGGYETLSVRTLRAVNLSPADVRGSADGAVYGLGAGVRLGFLTLGGRYRNASLTRMSLNTLTGELGARIALDRFEPYFLFGAGYAWATANGDALASAPGVSISGLNGRAGIGVDYYPDPRVSLGVSLMGEMLALARAGFSATESPEAQARAHLATCNEAPSPSQQTSCAINLLSDAEGSTFAVGATFSFMMGLHF
jgi:hypothetical protein